MKTLGLMIVLLIGGMNFAHAQERTAGQVYDAQVNWNALANKIDLVSSQNQALAALLTKVQDCNKIHKIYAPGTTGADSNGCAGVTPKLTVTFVSANVCKKGGVVTNTVTCPPGTQIVSCSGTPGDQDENGEGSIIKPYGNGCLISVQHQVCGKNDKEIQQGWVYASCAKME